MKSLDNLLNAAASGIANSVEKAKNNAASQAAANAAPKSEEVARIEQETQLQTAKMAFSSVKKMLIVGGIFALLCILLVIGGGIYMMNKAQNHADRALDRASNAASSMMFGW